MPLQIAKATRDWREQQTDRVVGLYFPVQHELLVGAVQRSPCSAICEGFSRSVLFAQSMETTQWLCFNGDGTGHSSQAAVWRNCLEEQ